MPRSRGFRSYQPPSYGRSYSLDSDPMELAEKLIDITEKRKKESRETEKYEFERGRKEKSDQAAEDERIFKKMQRDMESIGYYGATEEEIYGDLKNPDIESQAETKFKTYLRRKREKELMPPSRSGGSVDRSAEQKESALLSLQALDPKKVTRSEAIRIVTPLYKTQKWMSDPDLSSALDNFPETLEEPPKKLGFWGSLGKGLSDFASRSRAKPSKPDEFGFTIGQTRPARGKTYRYIGNNQWEEQ